MVMVMFVDKEMKLHGRIGAIKTIELASECDDDSDGRRTDLCGWIGRDNGISKSMKGRRCIQLSLFDLMMLLHDLGGNFDGIIARLCKLWDLVTKVGLDLRENSFNVGINISIKIIDPQCTTIHVEFIQKLFVKA